MIEWFDAFKRADFARSGNKALESFELPAGPLSPLCSSTGADDVAGPINLTEDTPAPHSLEPQLRKLGMVTSLIRGVPTLGSPHVVCSKGDVLNANQVQLLKLFSKCFATVRPLPRPLGQD